MKNNEETVYVLIWKYLQDRLLRGKARCRAYVYYATFCG